VILARTLNLNQEGGEVFSVAESKIVGQKIFNLALHDLTNLQGCAEQHIGTMVTKSKLKMALAVEKGVDFGKLHLKKKEKAARKGKAKIGGEVQPVNEKKVEEEWEDVEEEDEDERDELDEQDSGSEEEIDGPMKVSYVVCICFLL
jgi:hypothetical protein